MANTDLVGCRFSRLVVVADAGRVVKTSGPRRLWLCRCDCGVEKKLAASDLRSGRVQSCGCLRRETTAARTRTHDRTHTREFAIWKGIKDRCSRERSISFKYYGAKGIAMSDEWRSDFAAFFRDMGPAPSRRHTIDRIDGNGNYEKGNCRWATHTEQAWNTSRNPRPVWLGVPRTYKELGELSGIPPRTLYDRVHSKGWDLNRAMSQPVLTPTEAIAVAREGRWAYPSKSH